MNDRQLKEIQYSVAKLMELKDAITIHKKQSELLERMFDKSMRMIDLLNELVDEMDVRLLAVEDILERREKGQS